MMEFTKPFSHIYVEETALKYDRTTRILAAFPNARVIRISDYRDIFNRRNQNPGLQHKSQKLILAVKKDGFLYEGAPVCQSFGEEDFFYTSNVMNCVYDCDYCFLKGMYPTSNMVVFVNLEDTFAAVEERIRSSSMAVEEKIASSRMEVKEGSGKFLGADGEEAGCSRRCYISISYESDMLAIEGFTGMLMDWADWIRDKDSVLLELRTKCANAAAVRNLISHATVGGEKFIIAVTVSPDEVISKYEKFTPSLQARCEMVSELLQQGIPVRLAFDPMIYVKDYKKVYANMVDIISREIEWDKLRDVSLGSFRISKDYIKNFRKSYPNSPTAFFPYELREGYYQYPEDVRAEMEDFLYEILTKKLPQGKIFRWK